MVEKLELILHCSIWFAFEAIWIGDLYLFVEDSDGSQIPFATYLQQAAMPQVFSLTVDVFQR